LDWDSRSCCAIARVGVLNEIGALLDPAVVVLLIASGPAWRPAESLSAYLAHDHILGTPDATPQSDLEHPCPRGAGCRRCLAHPGAGRTKCDDVKPSGIALKEEIETAAQLAPP